MDFFDKLDYLGFKNGNLLGRLFVKSQQTVEFCIKDGIINTDSIYCKGFEFYEFLRRKFTTGNAPEIIIRSRVHMSHFFCGTVVFKKI